MIEAQNLGPMIPWACTMWIDGEPFGITLYATDADQIERDFPDIRVEGRLVGWLDA